MAVLRRRGACGVQRRCSSVRAFLEFFTAELRPKKTLGFFYEALDEALLPAGQ
eukprot:Skav210652  [mRNA]  locus=scaffold2527:94617:96453:+ [translate_table: standard]